MKACPYCQHRNYDDAEFCAGCGTELIRTCAACDKHAPADARYCPYCGAPILVRPQVRRVGPSWLTPELRLSLFALGRGLGATMIALAFVTALLTPPPRVFDEVLLLISGTVVLLLAEWVKPDRKLKPPDDEGGDGRPPAPTPIPPDGIEFTPEYDRRSPESVTSRPPEEGPRFYPPGPTDGPSLN